MIPTPSQILTDEHTMVRGLASSLQPGELQNLFNFYNELKQRPHEYLTVINEFGGEELQAKAYALFQEGMFAGVGAQSIIKKVKEILDHHGSALGFEHGIASIQKLGDYAAGPNTFSKEWLRHLGWLPEVHSMDINPHMQRFGIDHPNITNHKHDIANLSGRSPKEVKDLDMAALHLFVQYSSDQQNLRALENIHKDLKDGGLLSVSMTDEMEPFKGSFLNAVRKIGYKVIYEGDVSGKPFDYLDDKMHKAEKDEKKEWLREVTQKSRLMGRVTRLLLLQKTEPTGEHVGSEELELEWLPSKRSGKRPKISMGVRIPPIGDARPRGR